MTLLSTERFGPEAALDVPADPSLNVIRTEGAYDTHLCDEAESRMERAMELGALIVVNDLMVVKGIGKVAGLPLRRLDSESGTFFPDAWHMPHGMYVRNSILEAYLAGETSCTIPGIAWASCRGVKLSRMEGPSSFAGLSATLAQSIEDLPHGTLLRNGMGKRALREEVAMFDFHDR